MGLFRSIKDKACLLTDKSSLLMYNLFKKKHYEKLIKQQSRMTIEKDIQRNTEMLNFYCRILETKKNSTFIKYESLFTIEKMITEITNRQQYLLDQANSFALEDKIEILNKLELNHQRWGTLIFGLYSLLIASILTYILSLFVPSSKGFGDLIIIFLVSFFGIFFLMLREDSYKKAKAFEQSNKESGELEITFNLKSIR